MALSRRAIFGAGSDEPGRQTCRYGHGRGAWQIDNRVEYEGALHRPGLGQILGIAVCVLTNARFTEPTKYSVRHIIGLTIGPIELTLTGLHFVQTPGLGLTAPVHSPIRLKCNPDPGTSEVLFGVHRSGAPEAPQGGQHRGLAQNLLGQVPDRREFRGRVQIEIKFWNKGDHVIERRGTRQAGQLESQP